MMKKKSLPDPQKISSFFANQQLANLLIEQVNQFYLHQISSQFSMSLITENTHLYIFFQRNKLLQSEKEKDLPQQYGAYAIKITRGFPVEGLKVYILNNCYTPRIFDCRDISRQILRDEWTYKNRLVQILIGIDSFQQKLFSRNNKPIAMQKTGQFKMGDLFGVHQLKKFSALETFQDFSRQSGALLGTTETHFLVFKNSPQPNCQGKFYQLVRACQLQCISDIFHNEQNQIIITINKYKKVKQFNQYQKISRKYKVDDSHQLLRNILKNIVQFQKIEIVLKLNSQIHKNDKAFEHVNNKIQQAKILQQKLLTNLNQGQKNQIQETLIKNYHSIIEHFSERANAYYNIFVGKLNKIYAIRTARSKNQQ